ncbi:MAG: glycosyltransferase family 2 protein [Candidatus Ozemobacteraceae bacterium]
MLRPKISLIIVCRNEEKYIAKALHSFVCQDYPQGLTEIIVVDGNSSDETVNIAASILKDSGLQFQIIHNPHKTLATGWNLAIRAASGEFVCRIDAHGELKKDYLSRGIAILQHLNDPNVICIGGILENIGEGFLGKIAEDLFSSVFGVGNSPFRIKANGRFYSDTAAMGIYKKSVFDEVAYFDESLDRNQDIALHQKFRVRGLKFVTEPEMVFRYHVRSTFLGLLKKAYQDGYWVIYSGASYARHKIPLFFFFYLCFLFFIKIIRKPLKLAFFPLQFYSALALFFSVKDGKGISKLLLPFLFIAYHATYGFGSFVALMKPRRSGKLHPNLVVLVPDDS